MAGEKTIFRKSWKLFRNLIFSLLLATVLYFVMALLLSYLPTHPQKATCQTVTETYITTNGVHLDIVLPVESLDAAFRRQLKIPGSVKYVSFGWGDQEFYQKTPEWSDLTLPVAFQAVFLKGKSAMHVTWYSRSHSGWHKLELCEKQLKILNRYVKNSFQKNSNGQIQKCSFRGYTSSDFFYEGKGSFTLFRTCNVWVNNALKQLEIKTSVWSPFDFGVLYHIRNSDNF